MTDDAYRWADDPDWKALVYIYREARQQYRRNYLLHNIMCSPEADERRYADFFLKRCQTVATMGRGPAGIARDWSPEHLDAAYVAAGE